MQTFSINNKLTITAVTTQTFMATWIVAWTATPTRRGKPTLEKKMQAGDKAEGRKGKITKGTGERIYNCSIQKNTLKDTFKRIQCARANSNINPAFNKNKTIEQCQNP